MKVNYSELNGCKTTSELSQKLDELMRSIKTDDPPFLSDCLVNLHQGGHHLLIELGEREKSEIGLPENQRLRWHIRVIRDQWGNPPNPGDKVERRIQKKLEKRYGNETVVVTGNELSASKADGSYEDKWVNKYYYEIDEKGCVLCGFSDAVYFLNNYGIHSVTKYSLTTKKEHSAEPVDAPNGDKLHVWYRRYEEADKEQYAKLPIIKTDPTYKKRGINAA